LGDDRTSCRRRCTRTDDVEDNRLTPKVSVLLTKGVGVILGGQGGRERGRGGGGAQFLLTVSSCVQWDERSSIEASSKGKRGCGTVRTLGSNRVSRPGRRV